MKIYVVEYDKGDGYHRAGIYTNKKDAEKHLELSKELANVIDYKITEDELRETEPKIYTVYVWTSIMPKAREVKVIADKEPFDEIKVQRKYFGTLAIYVEVRSIDKQCGAIMFGAILANPEKYL